MCCSIVINCHHFACLLHCSDYEQIDFCCSSGAVRNSVAFMLKIQLDIYIPKNIKIDPGLTAIFTAIFNTGRLRRVFICDIILLVTLKI